MKKKGSCFICHLCVFLVTGVRVKWDISPLFSISAARGWCRSCFVYCLRLPRLVFKHRFNPFVVSFRWHKVLFNFTNNKRPPSVSIQRAVRVCAAGGRSQKAGRDMKATWRLIIQVWRIWISCWRVTTRTRPVPTLKRKTSKR